MIPIERTNELDGRYHVLGGALSPIDGVDPEDLRIAELIERVEANGVREVVIATNATTTGEATALYLADALRERAPEVAVTRLASGLPVGSDLEYADEITLGRALKAGRRCSRSGAGLRCSALAHGGLLGVGSVGGEDWGAEGAFRDNQPGKIVGCAIAPSRGVFATSNRFRQLLVALGALPSGTHP